MALREAHSAGLIHRDVKPSNIFAARRGELDDVAKLLDFGLVHRSLDESVTAPSGMGKVLGTPLYMSPEQARGERQIDHRSDIYSLGAVAYYLLSGQPPFMRGNTIATMIAHAREPVTPLSSLREDIPDDLERIISRCLAKDPSDRFQTAECLEYALSQCSCVGGWDHKQAREWWRLLDDARPDDQ